MEILDLNKNMALIKDGDLTIKLINGIVAASDYYASDYESGIFFPKEVTISIGYYKFDDITYIVSLAHVPQNQEELFVIAEKAKEALKNSFRYTLDSMDMPIEELMLWGSLDEPSTAVN